MPARLTAKLGAGWIATAGDVAGAVAAMTDMRDRWRAAGRSAEPLDAVVLTGGAVLEEGEPANSPRVVAQAGPRAAMLLHRAADAALAGLPMMAPMPPSVAETVAGYVELARKFTPQGAHYLENHRGHLMFVKPRGAAVCHRRADPPDHLHRDREGTERTLRSAGRGGL